MVAIEKWTACHASALTYLLGGDCGVVCGAVASLAMVDLEEDIIKVGRLAVVLELRLAEGEERSIHLAGVSVPPCGCTM